MGLSIRNDGQAHGSEKYAKDLKCRFKLFWRFDCIKSIYSGGHREGETPDPIPNSAVKPLVADGTMRKSMEE